MENYYYYSEMGCVKIGNDDFNMWLLNGKGEGSFWIHLCNKKENKSKKNFEFISEIVGKNINLYECDTSKNIILTLNPGKYCVYRKEGNILIEQF